MQKQVSVTLVGPVVLDYVQHFVERWNMIKAQKVTLHLYLVAHAIH